jgi:hypothetical protein
LFLWNVLRVYSWIFQTVLCLTAIAVSLAAYVTGSGDLVIPWVAFHASNQAPFLICIGVLGLFCVVLAVRGNLRILLFLFAIHSLYMLVKGLFINAGYSFAGPDDFRNAVILTVGAFFAVVGAWPVGPSKRR